MPDRTLTPLLEGGGFFEGPRWHGGRWWVSDFYRHAVYAVGTDGSEELVVEVENQPSGLGWLPDGSLLIVSMKDQRILRRDDEGRVSTHADLGSFTESPLNDMVVDTSGRAWVGCFGFDLMAFADPQLAPLMRVDPDGTATLAADEMMFPNGSVITPDGGTLIVGETAGCRYTAFTIQRDGSLTDRRVWAQLAPTPELGPLQEMLAKMTVGPDGCTLDAEGHIWSADEAGARCIRIAPRGEIVDEIRTPEGLGCFACALGGEDGRTLLLCAAPDFLETNRRESREAVLLTVPVEVPHAGLP
ncbi:MAG TPA: SMP-30/gluconolactonase/LRE family protein [Solirubrobacteraceae bacterium]|nr:SMP-30/gluconolactonase/LRE family protein [Solirubrobacteraceae bacterium]